MKTIGEPLRISRERPRGCGTRKVGGIYLVTDGPGQPCGRFPIPLEVCPCCGAGFKPSRAPSWVDGDAILATHGCATCDSDPRPTCPFRPGAPIGKAVLLWIGEQFYPTAASFIREAGAQGISRRIAQVPKGLEIGKTWILMAHRRGIATQGGDFIDVPEERGPAKKAGQEDLFPIEYTPAVVYAFVPQRVEVVVDEDVTDEQVEKYRKRGLSPVIVRPSGQEGEKDQ